MKHILAVLTLTLIAGTTYAEEYWFDHLDRMRQQNRAESQARTQNLLSQSPDLGREYSDRRRDIQRNTETERRLSDLEYQTRRQQIENYWQNQELGRYQTDRYYGR